MSENNENAYKMFEISTEKYAKDCVHKIKVNKKANKNIHYR